MSFKELVNYQLFFYGVNLNLSVNDACKRTLNAALMFQAVSSSNISMINAAAMHLELYCSYSGYYGVHISWHYVLFLKNGINAQLI